jgi:hypothetical protein
MALVPDRDPGLFQGAPGCREIAQTTGDNEESAHAGSLSGEAMADGNEAVRSLGHSSNQLAFRPLAHVRNFFAQGSSQVDLVVLLLDQDLPDRFDECEFAEGFALPHAIAVVANRFVLIVEIESQHLLGVFGRFDRLRRDRGHLTEIVDLAGNRERMLQFLRGVQLELIGDTHVLGALEHL